MILALAMSGDDLVGLIIAVLITAYLIYALIAPEKL
jgi:K+-transporting ATPase KdpF subunit